MSGRLRRLPRRKRFSGQSFNRMLPSLLTLVGLCVGLSAIRLALDGRFGAAVIAIAVSGAIDGLDGRLARLLKATSRFGAEIDSLADFLCFGVAPALVIYLWSLQNWGGIGFLPPLIFACAMALRLARFNAALDTAPRAAFAYNFFTGVPAPAGAGLALFPLFVGLEADQLQLVWLRQVAGVPAVYRRRADRRGAAVRLHHPGVELQELQNPERGDFAAVARRGGVRRHPAGRPLCRFRAARHRLYRHAAVQPAQLPPLGTDCRAARAARQTLGEAPAPLP